MNTQKWGASGWQLLYTLVYDYTDTDKESVMFDFLDHLKLMLPCKYCRKSYTEYISELPIPRNDNNRDPYKNYRWIWLMKNKVNAKLRRQGYNKKKDLSFNDFLKRLQKRENICVDNTNTCGMDFIFAIVFNYPEPEKKKMDDEERYKRFVELLGYLHPCNTIRTNLQNLLKSKKTNDIFDSREHLQKNMYRVFFNCMNMNDKECESCSGYTGVCQKYNGFRTVCSKNTCR